VDTHTLENVFFLLGPQAASIWYGQTLRVSWIQKNDQWQCLSRDR